MQLKLTAIKRSGISSPEKETSLILAGDSGRRYPTSSSPGPIRYTYIAISQINKNKTIGPIECTNAKTKTTIVNHGIQRVIEQTFRRSEPWAIVYLDLDNFKAYNGAYGFINGNLMMLKAVTNTMQLIPSESCAVFLLIQTDGVLQHSTVSA